MKNPLRFPNLPAIVGIGIALWMAGSNPGSAQQSPAGGNAYREPEHQKLPFSAENISLEAAAREKLIGALIAAARNFEVSSRLQAQTVAVALRIDPVNKAAFVTNFQLSRGAKPKPVDGFEDPADTAAAIFEVAQKIDTDSGEAATLRGYLIDITTQLDPDHAEAAYEMALVKKDGATPEWAAVLGEKGTPSAPKPGETPGKTPPVAKSIAATKSPGAMRPPTKGPPGTPGPDSGGIAKTQSLIKGLLVQQVEGSNYAGQATQMNATAVPASGNREIEVKFNQEVGPMMTSALREVMKHLRERHDGKLPTGHDVEISFEEQYIDKDGPSAAVACALLLEGLISGREFDSGFAVTGDMNADGSVQPVGGVDAKIRGAAKRDCDVVAIPKENEVVISDLLLTAGPAEVAKIQIFRLDTFDQALALSKVHGQRDDNLRTAIDQFAEVQKVLERPNGMSFLKNSHVTGRLRTVLELAPNHLSARYLLLKGIGREPESLSLTGSLQEIDRAAAPLIRAIRQGKFEPRESNLDADEFGDAASNLRRTRKQLDRRTWKCADAILDYASLMRTWVNNRPTAYNNIMKLVGEIRTAGQKVSREYDTLENRPDVREEMMR